MDQTFMNELKRLGQELNDLAKEIDNDTADKRKKANDDISAVYEVMKNDLEELQKLAQESRVEIRTKIPCDFTDSSIKEFRFWFPGNRFSNHKEVGLEWIYGDSTSNPNKRNFEGWLYNWNYSRVMIMQSENRWINKYLKKIFDHIINDWTELKPIIEAEFVKQYKEKLTDRVQTSIKKNETAGTVI